MEKDLLDWIKKELVVKNISQRELARKTGFSNTFFHLVLAEKRAVTLTFCQAIANGLNVPIWKIFILAGITEDAPESVLNLPTPKGGGFQKTQRRFREGIPPGS